VSFALSFFARKELLTFLNVIKRVDFFFLVIVIDLVMIRKEQAEAKPRFTYAVKMG
jgi:hypothetical protein